MLLSYFFFSSFLPYAAKKDSFVLQQSHSVLDRQEAFRKDKRRMSCLRKMKRSSCARDVYKVIADGLFTNVTEINLPYFHTHSISFNSYRINPAMVYTRLNNKLSPIVCRSPKGT